MEKFDDDFAAKEAIASSPEITHVEQEHGGADNAEGEAVKQAVHVTPSLEDKRNARLSSALIKGVVSAFGGEADCDQLSATEELTTEGFCALSNLNPPRWLKIGITSCLLIGSFTPVIIAGMQSIKNIKGGADA